MDCIAANSNTEDASTPSSRTPALEDAPGVSSRVSPLLEGVFELNRRLCAENELLKAKIRDLESKLGEMSRSVEEETNAAIDKDFEEGIFVENKVLEQLERENGELRKTLEEFYNKALKEWYDEMRAKYSK